MIGFSILADAGTGRAAPQRQPGPAFAKGGKFEKITALATGGDSTSRLVVRGLVVAAIYFAAMVGGILLTRMGGSVAPVWIPTAVLAYALLTAPPSHWALLTGFTAVAHVIGGFLVGDQLDVEMIYLVANLSAPLLFAALMRWRGDQLAFEERGEVVRFLIFGGLLAPALSAGIVAAQAYLSGQFSAQFASVWFLAESLSFIAFLPIIKTLMSGGWRDLTRPDQRIRALLLFGVLIAAHVAAMTAPAVGYRVFMLLLLPYMIYMAFELGLAGARAAIGVSAVLVVVYMLFVPAPPDREMGAQAFLIAMQIYMAAMVGSVLPLAVALAEKQRLYETASEALNDAQSAWGELIAAEAHYRLIADNTSDLILRVGTDGIILFASPAWRDIGADPDDMAGKTLRELVHPDDRDFVRSEFVALVATASVGSPRTWQFRLRDMNAEWGTFRATATLLAPNGGAADEVVAVLRRVQE